MATRSFDRVETWDSRPVDGLEALRDLAADGFSGAATADGTWAFFLNGRVVGVFDGDLEAFRSAEGTAYAAPEPAMALLVAMRERGGETQAQYYTNDTPLSEVAETLSEANFTGYVELSENVLSGDYYLVYHGGERLAVAVVGNREEVVAGTEAYELAADEVGIYEVVSVDVSVAELPEPEPEASGGAVAGTGGAVDDGVGETADDATDATDTATADDAGPPVEEAEPTPDDDGDRPPGDDSDATVATPEPEESDVGAAEPTDDAGEAGAGDGATTADTSEADGSGFDANVDDAASPETGRPDASAPASGDRDQRPGDDDRFREEESWRDTVSVPAVAPEDTGTDDGAAEAAVAAEQSTDAGTNTADENRQRGQGGGARRRELRSELEAARDRLATLEAEREELAAERDDLRQERDRLRERTEELREEVAELRSALSSARESADTPESDGDQDASPADAAAASGAGDDAASAAADPPTGGAAEPSVEGPISPAEALAGTDLFVRYGSRGEDTLDDVPGGASQDTLRANLRLDHHTQFDEEAVTVAGEPYEAFLESTAEHGFVTWLVEELPFEIRATGHEAALSDLYEALPEVDRAELDGTVSVETADGETVSRSFDVVVRDRMGNALVVADLNDRRAPVSAEMMDDLVTAAADVGEATELAAAVYVTASFFEPDALETAASATGGGFLRRDKRESYVKTGRKAGFHLCLVESRDGDFYLTVPEL